ncbi:MAG: DnaD domain protein [Ruminococcaceae bacterium]|nr:DnaD domain protein [Oscillospiraceae bacterium]
MAYTHDDGVFLEESFLLEIMPGIKAEHIKIYIFAKYLAQKNGGKTDLHSLADALTLDISCVREAVHSLASMGIILLGANGIISLPDKNKKTPPYTDERKSYMSGEVSTIIASDKELSDMLSLAQKILGRLLSYQAIEKLYGLYDWLGMSPELILRLLEYCVELGKKDIRYIEKVAISWNEMGISSINDAESYIQKQNYKRTYQYSIQKLFGIDTRSLTPSEQKYIDSWYALGISKELAAFAYDYAVSKTGKLAMAYINKVLVSWHETGIKTASQAQESIKNFVGQNPQTKTPATPTGKLGVYNSGRYNYDEIDALARKKLKERLGKE